jgi:hypothetical protein
MNGNKSILEGLVFNFGRSKNIEDLGKTNKNENKDKGNFEIMYLLFNFLK